MKIIILPMRDCYTSADAPDTDFCRIYHKTDQSAELLLMINNIVQKKKKMFAFFRTDGILLHYSAKKKRELKQEIKK